MLLCRHDAVYGYNHMQMPYQVHIMSSETHRVGREDNDEYFIMKLHKDVAY